MCVIRQQAQWETFAFRFETQYFDIDLRIYSDGDLLTLLTCFFDFDIFQILTKWFAYTVIDKFVKRAEWSVYPFYFYVSHTTVIAAQAVMLTLSGQRYENSTIIQDFVFQNETSISLKSIKFYRPECRCLKLITQRNKVLLSLLMRYGSRKDSKT